MSKRKVQVHWGYERKRVNADGSGEFEERFTECGIHEREMDHQLTFRNPEKVTCPKCLAKRKRGSEGGK